MYVIYQTDQLDTNSYIFFPCIRGTRALSDDNLRFSVIHVSLLWNYGVRVCHQDLSLQVTMSLHVQWRIQGGRNGAPLKLDQLCFKIHFVIWECLKEHCTQKKIWIHLMQNIFRNQTVKNLTILDNPFKRNDFSKFSLNSVKSLCRPHKLATVPCHGCTTPHWFCTQIITNFQFSWIWVKLFIKLIPKSIHIHIYPKQTWLISRGNLLFTWELYF